MKPTIAPITAVLLTSLAALHAAEPITNSIGMKLMPIQPGTFTMGQDGPPLEDYMGQHRLGEMYKDIDRIDFDEKPAHKVTITQAFHIGVTEVTVAQYRQFDPSFKTSDAKSKPAEDDAASGISWHKAVAFCEWLSKKEGKTYRLPTEAEWEYACRAGTTTLFNTGEKLPDGHQKWFGDENLRVAYFPPGPMPQEYDWRKAGEKAMAGLKYGELVGGSWTHENARHDAAGSLRVALKTPNAWGLHDMHGNLAEWCSDWYGPYESGAQTDPLGRVDGDFRVFRGGFHSSLIRFLRSANRGSRVPYDAFDRMGFRVVQGELPKGTMLPKAPPPLNAQNVIQTVPHIVPQAANVPFFVGPKLLVHVADDAVGPVYCSENHCMTITECPNGDLLAAWVSTPAETDLTCSHAASRLRFGAKEWEPASPFNDAADVLDGAPQLWWDGDKTLYHLDDVYYKSGCQSLRHSTDNGATWSKPKFFRAAGDYANQLMRTKDGVLAIPYDLFEVMVSEDGGKSWQQHGRRMRGSEDVRPGNSGSFIAGYHPTMVELSDGRWMAFSRLDPVPEQARFENRTPVSYSSDHGKTWQWDMSEFPVVSSAQKSVLLRLKEGALLFCSFTDQWRDWRNRKGLVFKSTDGDYSGYGLFAAVSYDEGKTWPDRRLITPGGPERKWITKERTPFLISDTLAEPASYLSATQSRDGNIQLVTSRNHYAFNLAWIKAPAPAPKK
jgi:formylglycine-generating enzyme required for sulfatase activity